MLWMDGHNAYPDIEDTSRLLMDHVYIMDCIGGLKCHTVIMAAVRID